MDGKSFPSLIWRVRRFAAALSWPSIAAAGLIVVEAAFHFSTMAPLEIQRAQLREQVARSSRDSSQATERSAASDPRVDLEKFYGALARPADAPDLLRRLHRVAHDQGLTLDQADYRPVPDADGGFTRYQILLPAKGTYPEVRRFLVQVSGDVPGLAVDSVNFQRQQIGDPQVDALIKLTLFIKVQS